MMNCKVSKDPSSSKYWIATATDSNVRVDPDDAAKTITSLDSNNLLASGGQDWSIPDSDYNMQKHLCTTQTDSTISDVYQC